MDIEDTDFTWIEDFHNREKEYDKFYKAVPQQVTGYLLFIDRKGEVKKFEALRINLANNGVLLRDILLKLIARGKQKKKYIYQGLLKYNITIAPENIEKLVTGKIADNEYLTYTQDIEDIKFNDTIEMFQNLNNVVLLFREKSLNLISLNKTKRNYREGFSKTRKIPTKTKHT